MPDGASPVPSPVIGRRRFGRSPGTGRASTPPSASTAPAPPPGGRIHPPGHQRRYIDPAVPADQLRLRADFGYDFRTPTRAEFFYAKSRPLGPGLPAPERAVDFQDYTLHLEKTLGPGWSVFAE